MNNFLKTLFGFNQQNNQEVGDFEDQSVSWEPVTIKTGANLEIKYNGLLKNAGAKEVYLHYGFDSWSHEIQTVKMEPQEDGSFNHKLEAKGEHEINFCFRDPANNWDNNNGWNWNIGLQ